MTHMDRDLVRSFLKVASYGTLKEHIEKVRSTSPHHMPETQSTAGNLGFGGGSILGGLGGAAYGAATGKSIPGRIWRGATRGLVGTVGGAIGGSLAGLGVGGLIAKLKGEKGAPYTEQDIRMEGIREYLDDYATHGPKSVQYGDWESPKGLTPMEAQEHAKARALEEEYFKTKGRSPW